MKTAAAKQIGMQQKKKAGGRGCSPVIASEIDRSGLQRGLRPRSRRIRNHTDDDVVTSSPDPDGPDAMEKRSFKLTASGRETLAAARAAAARRAGPLADFA
jgi:hypothetical protein